MEKKIGQIIVDKVKRPGGLGEHALCNLCAEEFADGLAWCAHRPWKSVTRRDTCKWPKALRKSDGIWSLRPSCREAVQIAEDGPPAEFRIQWPTLASASKNRRSRGKSNVPKTQPHNHAGFRASLSAESEGRA